MPRPRLGRSAASVTILAVAASASWGAPRSPLAWDATFGVDPAFAVSLVPPTEPALPASGAGSASVPSPGSLALIGCAALLALRRKGR